MGGIIDYENDARGEQDTPVGAARAWAERNGLPGHVQPTGYPAAETPLLRVVSEGLVVATIWVFADGQGGWLVSGYVRCQSPAP